MFQAIQKVNYSGNNAVGILRVPGLGEIMPLGHYHDHVIHPITLDGLLQILFPALGGGVRYLPEVMIPVYIEDLWISNNVPNTAGYRLCGYTEAKFGTLREANGWAMFLDNETREPRIVMSGLRSRAVTSADFSTTPIGGGEERKLGGYNMSWKPDIGLLDAD